MKTNQDQNHKAKAQPLIIPVILAGGQGLRLRPLTSDRRSKPFLKTKAQRTLLQDTIERFAPFGAPVIVCDQNHVTSVQSDMDALGYRRGDYHIIAEPTPRSTAPAITAAACFIRQTYPDAIMLVTPSDHRVNQSAALQNQIQSAATANAPAGFTLFGAKPTYPSTRFGYIKHSTDGMLQGFKEKPAQKTARAYLSSPNTLWNTGIFMCRPQNFLDKITASAPNISAITQAAYRNCATAGNIHTLCGSYKNAPSLAVDIAVMEHLKTARVITLNTGWNDLGTRGAFLSNRLTNYFKSDKAAA